MSTGRGTSTGTCTGQRLVVSSSRSDSPGMGGSMMVAGDGVIRHTAPVAGLKIGYARVSTDEQDLTAQREALAALGVTPDRIYVDHGLTGTNRDRPGLREAMMFAAAATYRSTKLDRLARSLPDARDIVRRAHRPRGRAEPWWLDA